MTKVFSHLEGGRGGGAIDHRQTFAYDFHSVIIMMIQSSNSAISAFDSSLRIRG